MEEAGQRDRITSTATSPSPSALSPGGRPVEPNLTEQPLPRNNERLVSANPSPAAAVTGHLRDVTDQIGSSYRSGTVTPVYPQDQPYFYGGYESSTGNWDDYSRYVNANGVQVVSPAMYNDNSSMLRYGLDNQMAYGQFSPMASPMSPIMVDGQLYSPHQIPMSPNYFPQSVSPGVPHVTSSLPMSQTELVTVGSSGQEGLGDSVHFGPGSGYFLHFGSFGGGGLSGETLSHTSNSESGGYMSQLTSPAVYHQPIGILGPYEHNFGQISQQRPFHGLGSAGSSFPRNYRHGSSYPSSNYGTASTSHWGINYRSRVTSDKGGRQERDRESIFASSDAHGISSDRNRGPRASKPKGKGPTEESSISGNSKIVASVSGDRGLYNQAELFTDYENAKFFVIKSFSEDNVHKSIKYGVWASTPLGNKKLEAAYSEAKDVEGQCPIFLLFSVNASGQFCGVAEMVGPVDFDNDADYWQQDRWSGQFPVRWHIIKDVPNGRFRHILLQNNENKPVTHSRDSQEVNREQGIEMLKIFKDHEAETCILDDFSFYDEREKALQERKARQHASSSTKKEDSVVDVSIKQLSVNLADALLLEDGGKEESKTK